MSFKDQSFTVINLFGACSKYEKDPSLQNKTEAENLMYLLTDQAKKLDEANSHLHKQVRDLKYRVTQLEETITKIRR